MLARRISQIGVHLALLLVMSGGNLSAAGNFSGDVTVPHGLDFVAGDVPAPSGVQSSTPSDALSTKVHVNRFYVDHNEKGEVSQFHTDLSLFDNDGKEVVRKTISVHDPLRSVLARDLQSIILYDKEGNIPIEIDGTKIIIVERIRSSSLDLETDPGIQIVSAGFGYLMLNTCISYLSRAQDEFPGTVNRMLDQVSNLVESSLIEESDSSNGF